MWELLRERWEGFTNEQKLSVTILSVCGLLAMGLSVMRLNENIHMPFLINRDAILATKKLVGESLAEQEAKQKRMDTDGDGLSDYDETNTFHTNANLRDTCGDGLTDNVRVATGKNLYCDGQQANPSGFVDVSGVMHTSSSALGTQGLDLSGPQMIGLDTAGLLRATGEATGEPGDVSQILPRDAAAIRAALQGRVDAAKLAQLSDEQLLRIYDQAVVQFTSSSSSTDGSAGSP